MTREEVIRSLDICTSKKDVPCSGSECSYKDSGDCVQDLLKDALVQIESDRDKALEPKAEKVVEYKILNREDLLTAFHEYIYAQADFYMNYTGREESTETARTCMSEICGAAVLMNNILNPRKESKDANE